MSEQQEHLSAFRAGVGMAGWCCAKCHARTFQHDGKHRRTFASFLWHRLVAHGLLSWPVRLDGPPCVLTHGETRYTFTITSGALLTYTTAPPNLLRPDGGITGDARQIRAAMNRQLK